MVKLLFKITLCGLIGSSALAGASTSETLLPSQTLFANVNVLIAFTREKGI